jgi:hypothetical protein
MLLHCIGTGTNESPRTNASGLFARIFSVYLYPFRSNRGEDTSSAYESGYKYVRRVSSTVQALFAHRFRDEVVSFRPLAHYAHSK